LEGCSRGSGLGCCYCDFKILRLWGALLIAAVRLRIALQRLPSSSRRGFGELFSELSFPGGVRCWRHRSQSDRRSSRTTVLHKPAGAEEVIGHGEGAELLFQNVQGGDRAEAAGLLCADGGEMDLATGFGPFECDANGGDGGSGFGNLGAGAKLAGIMTKTPSTPWKAASRTGPLRSRLWRVRRGETSTRVLPSWLRTIERTFWPPARNASATGAPMAAYIENSFWVPLFGCSCMVMDKGGSLASGGFALDFAGLIIGLAAVFSGSVPLATMTVRSGWRIS
jgi:hypothetical protein